MADFQSLFEHMVLPHWPFLAWMTIAALIGHVMEISVFTRVRALTPGKGQWIFWWGYKTLALHPVIAGVFMGIFWNEPEPDITKLPARMTYFALSGALSNVAFAVAKKFALREGIDLTLPGESKIPSDRPPALAPTVVVVRDQQKAAPAPAVAVTVAVAAPVAAPDPAPTAAEQAALDDSAGSSDTNSALEVKDTGGK